MKPTYILLCFVLLFCSCSGTSVPPPQPFNVFGYLPEYRANKLFPYETFFANGLTHLIFFSVEINNSTLGIDYIEERLPPVEEWNKIRELADKYNVKLMVCVGGSDRSEAYPTLVRSNHTENFFSQLKSLYVDRKLDGFDFNWEYPALEEDYRKMNEFLIKARAALNSTGRPPIVSMPAHPHPTTSSFLRLSGINDAVDYIHWMAYGTVERLSVLMQPLVLEGFYDNIKKLTLGLDFYATNGPQNATTYSEVVVRALMQSEKPATDEVVQRLKESSNEGGFDFTGYYGVQKKMDRARQANFTGVMIWELGQDILSYPPEVLKKATDDATIEKLYNVSLMRSIHEKLTEWKKADPPKKDINEEGDL
ncbi:chitinase [Angomonas deanei]|nr:chitinase [Angomonas deanei]EPY40955.1 chitinase [Angomonas deanei]|eukprot:EPY38739.1 chitinase [Angomonas deanei]